jgi:hypothetical protein
MNLFRLFAYAVHPQRTADPADFAPPEGGQIAVNAELASVLEDALNKAAAEHPTRVNLRVTLDGARASELRDGVIGFVFADSNPGASSHAQALADRLSRSMDMRSPSCLFLVAGYRVNARSPQRQVALWVFPRDASFRFESRQHRIDIIEDSFSRTSRQRKLALMKGRNVRGQFHVADVLDFQARGRPGQIAEFWIENFLEADPAMKDDAGTRYLADIFAATTRRLTDPADIDQVQAAVIALRYAPPARRSINAIGEEFLDGAAKRAFDEQAQAALPSVDARRTVFGLERDLFAERLKFRAFRLGAGTRVIAPIGTMGDTVGVQRRESVNGAVEVLTVEDVIVDDKIQ